jgi:hypothetical protein
MNPDYYTAALEAACAACEHLLDTQTGLLEAREAVARLDEARERWFGEVAFAVPAAERPSHWALVPPTQEAWVRVRAYRIELREATWQPGRWGWTMEGVSTWVGPARPGVVSGGAVKVVPPAAVCDSAGEDCSTDTREQWDDLLWQVGTLGWDHGPSALSAVDFALAASVCALPGPV